MDAELHAVKCADISLLYACHVRSHWVSEEQQQGPSEQDQAVIDAGLYIALTNVCTSDTTYNKHATCIQATPQ